MAEVEKAHQVLAAERQAVLDGLQQTGKDYAAEWDRHEATLGKIQARSYDLLRRGKEAGATMKEMAEALNITRQRAHMMFRRAEGKTDVISYARGKRGRGDA